MQNGSLVLNGLTDKQFASILEFKAAHEGTFTLNVTQVQQFQPNPTTIVYNNILLGWPNDAGLRTLLQLLGSLVA
jgi:hypothetical protein